MHSHRFALLAALALAACAPAVAGTEERLAPVTLEDPGGALAPFYEQLAAAEAGTPGVAGRVLIAQYGDSHTAGDKLTGELRADLQARFGDAGRGFVLPGRPPLKHYYLGDVEYGTDGAWKVAEGWRKKNSSEPYGLAGVRSFASDRKALAWISTCDDCSAGTAVETFELYYVRQQDGGVLEARVDDGGWTRIDTAGAGELGYQMLEVDDGAHKLSLRPGKGGKEVGVFGIAMERRRPGVVVDSLGIVGLQMSHLWSWDWNVIGAQLAHRDPALVVLQYGTNEAGDEDFDVARFETRYVELVERIQQTVPGAAILILGPPDMAERELGSSKCKKLEKTAKKKGKPVPDGCVWKTPAILHDIIDAERRVAQQTSVAFFDSLAAMGGADLIDTMVKADPQLAYGDHVHFTGRGYALWGDLVREDLMRGYAAWQKQSGLER